MPAYNELTVTEDAEKPYITYQADTDSFEHVVALNATLWYNQYSWHDIYAKSEEIARRIYEMDPPAIPIDGGRLYITPGSPFARPIKDETNEMTRGLVININAEFQTAY